MADRTATIADYLAFLGEEMPRAASDDLTPPYGAAMPQSEAERRDMGPAALLPYAMMLPPVAAYRGGYDLARGIDERSPSTAAWALGEIGLAALPFLASARAASRPPAVARETSAGPWTPGYFDEWLAHRPHVPRHEINQTLALGRPMPRRAAASEPMYPRWMADLVWPGVGRRPRTAQEWRRYLRWQAANAAAADAAGLGAHFGYNALRGRGETPPDQAD